MMNIERIYFYPSISSNPQLLTDVSVVVNGIKLHFMRLLYVKQRGFLLVLPTRNKISSGDFLYRYYKLPSKGDFDRLLFAVVKRYLYCRTLPNWKLTAADAQITAEDIAKYLQASNDNPTPTP